MEGKRSVAIFGLAVALLIGASGIADAELQRGEGRPAPFEGSVRGATPVAIAHDDAIPPVRIDNDAGILASGLVSTGTGTPGDPYLIRDLVFDANGGSFALYVGNTSAHLILRNCTFTGATTFVSVPFFPGAGLALNNASNVKVQSSNATTNNDGIMVQDSDNATVNATKMNGNSNNGVTQVGGDNITFEGNEIGMSGNDGINIMFGRNNTISNSWIHNHSNNGVSLLSTQMNLVAGNGLNDSGVNGVYTFDADNNSFLNNTIHRVIGDSGIWWNSGSDDNVAIGNDVRALAACGGPCWGISPFDDAGTPVLRNRIQSNVIEGFDNPLELYGAHFGTVSMNTIMNSAAYGIRLEAGSTGNEISQNNITGSATQGIQLAGAFDNRFTYNLVQGSALEGASIFGPPGASTGNVFHHNTFLNNNGTSRQASDSSGGNLWNDSVTAGGADEGNHWSDFDSVPEGCVDTSPANGVCDSAYLIGGAAGAQDSYPLTTPTVSEVSPLALILGVVALLGALFIASRRT